MWQKSLAVSAARLRLVVIGLMVLIASIYLVSRLGIDLGHQLQVERRSRIDGAAGAIFADLAVILFLAALSDVVRLLGRLAHGEMFGGSVSRAFRGFARWLLLAAIVTIAGPPAAQLVQAASEGDSLLVRLVFDLRDVMFVIAALVIFLVARVLDEAARIDSELKEYV